MPPTFAYAMILFAYICFGALAVAVALALAVVRQTRTYAKRLAGGVIGSYPGVFIFQLMSVPVLIVLWATFWLLHRALPHPDGDLSVALGIVGALMLFGVFAAASLAGFVTGWSVGAALATGASFRNALVGTWVVRQLPGRLTTRWSGP